MWDFISLRLRCGDRNSPGRDQIRRLFFSLCRSCVSQKLGISLLDCLPPTNNMSDEQPQVEQVEKVQEAVTVPAASTELPKIEGKSEAEVEELSAKVAKQSTLSQASQLRRLLTDSQLLLLRRQLAR